MKTTIYLTRHGQTEWNLEKRLQGRGNSPLTEAGIKGAEELRDRIKNLKLHEIYSSPIERALITANIIKGDHNLQIKTEDGFMEMSFGDYEGSKSDDILKENPAFDMNLIMRGATNISAPNGETLTQVRARVSETMDRIINENRGKTILIVAHGITLKALMHYFKDNEVDGEVMGQASLTKVIVENDNEFKIEFKNDSSHLKLMTDPKGW